MLWEFQLRSLGVGWSLVLLGHVPGERWRLWPQVVSACLMKIGSFSSTPAAG